MSRCVTSAIAALTVLAMIRAVTAAAGQPAATAVIRYSTPATLPDRAISVNCVSPSRAAWFRSDTFTCQTLDPCFTTGPRQLRQVWCVSDPRRPDGGSLVNVAALTVADGVTSPAHRAWFFELMDGSTCRPLAAAGRTIEGEVELYGCQFGSDGDADAVFGDLDASAAVWTIRKVLINKKTEPQTIKSLSIAPVRTVWQ